MLEYLTLKPEIFGLDVSDLSIKIVKLREKKRFFGMFSQFSQRNSLKSIVSFGQTDIRPGIISGGEIVDKTALAKTIKEALNKVKGERIKTKYVVASLPEEKAFLQVIRMPKMKEEELHEAIKFEAENYIPLPINQVYLDSQRVLPFKDHLDHIDVLIAALPKKTIDDYTECFKNAGLTPVALEIEAQAIARALIEKGVSPSPVLLIDLGATRSSFIIFSGHSLRFTSSIPVSSRKLTEAITRQLDIDFDKAENLKIKHGLQGKQDQGKQVAEALIPALTDLAEQIRKHLEYYKSHASHEHLNSATGGVKEIYLCGGGANLSGLSEFLSDFLKMPVFLGDPWVNIVPEHLKKLPELSYKESLKYATVLGLAQRKFND